MTPNFVVWIVICYLSGFCWSRYITTESCQFTNLVLILIVLTSECLCPVSGILSSWYPCLCPRLSEDQSWLSRSRSGTCLSLRWWLLATGTPGPHWPRHGLSLVTWPHLWPLIGEIWTTASQVLLSSLVSGWLCGRHLAPRRPPGVCLNTRSESHDWGERGRILLWGIHLDNAAQRLGPASDTPESGGGWQHNLWLRCPLRLRLRETLDTWS